MIAYSANAADAYINKTAQKTIDITHVATADGGKPHGIVCLHP